MGAAHSRARPGAGPAKIARLKKGGQSGGQSDGGPRVECNYFILCLKMGDTRDRVKLVNASGPVLKLLTSILSRHCAITKSGWDRHLAFSFKLAKPPGPAGRHELIMLTSEILLTLYKVGWEPMTPIDLSVKGLENQTAICFRKVNTSSVGTPVQSAKMHPKIPSISVTGI